MPFLIDDHLVDWPKISN